MNKLAFALTLIFTNIATFAVSKMFFTGKQNSMAIVEDSPYMNLVQSYYEAMNTPPSENTAQMFSSIVAQDWVAVPSLEGGNGIEGIIKTLGMQYNIVPNMKTEIKEMIYSGNRITVISTISGNPFGQFMGVSTDGVKSFEIASVDIHTIRDSKIVETQRFADWSVAISQVKNDDINLTDNTQESLQNDETQSQSQTQDDEIEQSGIQVINPNSQIIQ